MNRKERRAAASQNKHVARTTLMSKNSKRATDPLMDSALRCHQAGKLAEAEHLYQRILAKDASHIGALHNP
jgi:hypothetical protein